MLIKNFHLMILLDAPINALQLSYDIYERIMNYNFIHYNAHTEKEKVFEIFFSSLASSSN